MNSEEIKSLYASGLKKLIFENQNSINALTHLAAEYQTYGAEVVSTIEEYIAKVDAKIKLCMLDLINCIIQKVGGVYIALFSENISIVFCKIFKAVDSNSRIKMYNIRQIWSNIFPAEKLYEIDFKANLLDSTWPVAAQNPYLVHVNPNCLPQYSLLRIQDELLEKEKALLEVQEKKLQIEVLKVQIKLGRQISFTRSQTDEHTSGNEDSGQYENIPSSEKTQEKTSLLHTSPDRTKENEYIQVTERDSNDENSENVKQFNKNRLQLDQRHATPFTLDTDGMYRHDDYHITPPIYDEPAERGRFGLDNRRNWRDRDDSLQSTPVFQQNSDYLSLETEGIENIDTHFSNVSERNGRCMSHPIYRNSFRQRTHFGRGGFRFANYRHWKMSRGRNRRGRFPGRFQSRFQYTSRNFDDYHHPYDQTSTKRKSTDFDRDCDPDLRNKLHCSNSNKKPNFSTNPSITKTKSASAENSEPAQNSVAVRKNSGNIENNLDITAIDIEKELARIEEVFCLLEEGRESPAKNSNNLEEEADSDFSEIYDVVESSIGSSEMDDETEEINLGKFSRGNLKAFPSREADPTGFTSSIDGNNECKPFTGTKKKVEINFKRLDKNKKSVPLIRKK